VDIKTTNNYPEGAIYAFVMDGTGFTWAAVPKSVSYTCNDTSCTSIASVPSS